MRQHIDTATTAHQYTNHTHFTMDHTSHPHMHTISHLRALTNTQECTNKTSVSTHAQYAYTYTNIHTSGFSLQAENEGQYEEQSRSGTDQNSVIHILYIAFVFNMTDPSCSAAVISRPNLFPNRL